MKQQSVIFCSGVYRYAANLFNQRLKKAADDGWSMVGEPRHHFFGLWNRKYLIWVLIEREFPKK